jgi:signal transduction histidine kinase
VTPSLRTRVILGAVLWTIGLSVLTAAAMAQIWRHLPSMPFLGHSGSIHYWVTHTVPAVIIAAIAMIAGLVQVRRGLSGITQLRQRLSAVHEGRDARVEGRYAAEVQPLVDDLNALLNHHDDAVRRAVAKAGDLAHGLKTPLAVMAREAERAEAAGQAEIAASIHAQIERMRRQVDYHMAHARAAASGATPGARSVVADSAQGLARTLLRLHADRALVIDVRVSPDHVAHVQREDLDEMLGNLLDNACKWARARVVVSSELTEAGIAMTVDDDGEGLPVAMRTAVLQRGVRADEKTPGFGLGLAIVRDLAEVYRGSISLDASPTGGLRAVLTLPGGEI